MTELGFVGEPVSARTEAIVTALDAGVVPVRGTDHTAVWATVTMELP